MASVIARSLIRLQIDARMHGIERRSRRSASAITNRQFITYSTMPQFIYTMKGLGKVHPPDARVLEDIWLSFYFGAKIGVLGLNGAGKSSLLQDHGGRGHELPRRGVSGRRHLGRLPAPGAAARSGEERARQRRGRRRGDQGAARRATTRSTRSSARICRRRRWTRSSTSSRKHPGQDRRVERLGSRFAARARDGRAAAAAAGRRRRDALGRRAPPRRALPPAAAVAGPAAARRADQPSRRRVGRLARALPQGLRRARSSPSRTIATSSTTSPAGFSSSIAAAAFRGKATTRRGSSRSRTGCSRKRRPRRKRQRTLERELEWIRMSPRARQAKGKARLNAYEDLLREDTAQKIETAEIYIAPGPAARRRRRRSARPAEGLRRQPADRRTSTSRCRAAASSASSARTAPARRRCSG